MPKRSQHDSPRKGAPRSGGRPDSRGNSSAKKSYKKDDSKQPKRSGGSFGGQGSGRSTRSSGPEGRPFKRSGSAPGRGKPFKVSGKQSHDDESRSHRFSQKSRFAKSTPKTSDSRGSRAGDERGRAPSKPFDKRSGSPRDGKDGVVKKRFSHGASTGNRGGSESFGKPYKKFYKSKPDRTKTSPSKRRQEAAEGAAKSDKIRLNKFIANSGISSRREADELITMGLISVNGQVISELGYKVSPGDEVRYENKVLRAEKPVYILLNKPKGFITTTEDPQERKTVMHIIGSAVKERIYPVGRLDRNTTGLLLLTNDGELADKLMHPSFNVKKIYKVELDRPLTKADFQTIMEGVRLEEGRATVDDLALASEDGRTIGIELHIGWNRVVRRIFENLGYEVLKLDRTVYAGLDKKELGRGQWRFLSKEEIVHLKHFK